MDVLSLLKFWRTAGDEASFFDLEFTTTNCSDSNSNNHYPFNTKRRILPLDSSTTKRPSSPFRVLKLGFQNKKTKSDKEMKCETEEVTISSLLKSNSEKYLNHDQIPSKRCLNLIKPLNVRVSKRSNENVRLPEQSPRKEEKRLGEIVFNEMRKHWGKRRSSSSVKPAPSPAVRSDDSALQQDGIQSAILHCKMSYDSPSTVSEWNVLSRSGSAPSSHGHRISVDEIKRSSI